MRILRAAEGARPVLIGFDTAEDAGACVAAIIGAGIIPVAIEYMDRPAIQICEAFAHAGYPLDVEAHADHRGRGLGGRDRRPARRASSPSPAPCRAEDHEGLADREAESAAIWKGRKSAFGATGRIADYICMDGTIPTGQLPDVLQPHRRDLRRATACASPTSSMPATATCIR